MLSFLLVFTEFSIIFFELAPVFLLQLWLKSMRYDIKSNKLYRTCVGICNALYGIYIANTIFVIVVLFTVLYGSISVTVYQALIYLAGTIALLCGLTVSATALILWRNSGCSWARSPDFMMKANQLLRIFVLGLFVAPPLFCSLFGPAGPYVSTVLLWIFNCITLWPKEALLHYDQRPDEPVDEDVSASQVGLAVDKDKDKDVVDYNDDVGLKA